MFLNCGLGKDSWESLGARRSNQSLLKEISPGCSLERVMLRLKLQYFGHLIQLTHWKTPWCWERLKAGGDGDDRGWDGSMASLTQGTWIWVISGNGWWTGRPGVLKFMGLQRVGQDWGTELNWTELNSVANSLKLSTDIRDKCGLLRIFFWDWEAQWHWEEQLAIHIEGLTVQLGNLILK